MNIILGIDPGVTGGIAFLRDDGSLTVYDIPVAGGEVNVDFCAQIVRALAPKVAIIERASAMPKQGVSSTFKFGQAYGALRAVVAVLEIPQHLVTPSKWKAHFRLDSDKEKSRSMAIRLWPGCGFFERKKDHGRAEAALIALYGSQVIEQNRRAA
jgi:crossover junction endodeoxyribonuclease RuvC